MAQFRVGQMVKVVDGPRAGAVTTIVSGPHTDRFERISGVPVFGVEHYVLDLRPRNHRYESVVAETSWLRPFDDGREKADLSAMPEWIRRLTKQRGRA